jgi:hypothetical protein
MHNSQLKSFAARNHQEDSMTLADNQPNQAKAPDLSLILARLEKGILAGDDLTECRQILNRDSLWKHAPAEIQLKRAQLAQMAGEVALALTILAAVNATEPNFSDAWTERLNLLGILDEKEKLAQVLAQARSRLSDDACRNWLRINEGQSPPLVGVGCGHRGQPLRRSSPAAAADCALSESVLRP